MRVWMTVLHRLWRKARQVVPSCQAVRNSSKRGILSTDIFACVMVLVMGRQQERCA